MDEFISDSILNSDKTTLDSCQHKRKGNLFQMEWEVILSGYKGKLRLQVNYVENVEIRVSLEEVFDKACLRRLEVPLNDELKYGHRNPRSCGNEYIFTGIHKHKYLDRVKDGCAYVPNDIDTKSIESIIRTFAKECNITLVGSLPGEIYQRTL